MAEAAESPPRNAFPVTHWSLIYLATQLEQHAGEGALNELLSRYYSPLIAHLRFKFGVSEEDGRDLLQGFVAQKIMLRGLLHAADRERGRFRTFLLKALDNYVIDQRRAANRQDRAPAAGVVPMAEAETVTGSVQGNGAVDPFDWEWAMRVIQQAEDQTRQFYESKGRTDTWGTFRDAVLVPLLEGQARPDDSELARRHGLASARQASNALTTAKRQFGKTLRRVIREYVETDSQVDEELRELMAIFARAN